VIVLDELIYASKRKYRTPYTMTSDLVETIILPYVTVVEIGEEEYREAANLIAMLSLKPSDALHLATMKLNNIKILISKDKEPDKTPNLVRVWLTVPLRYNIMLSGVCRAPRVHHYHLKAPL